MLLLMVSISLCLCGLYYYSFHSDKSGQDFLVITEAAWLNIAAFDLSGLIGVLLSLSCTSLVLRIKGHENKRPLL